MGRSQVTCRDRPQGFLERERMESTPALKHYDCKYIQTHVSTFTQSVHTPLQLQTCQTVDITVITDSTQNLHVLLSVFMLHPGSMQGLFVGH